VTLPASSTDDEVKGAALEETNVKKHTEGFEIKKVILVPKKLVSIVVGK